MYECLPSVAVLSGTVQVAFRLTGIGSIQVSTVAAEPGWMGSAWLGDMLRAETVGRRRIRLFYSDSGVAPFSSC